MSDKSTIAKLLELAISVEKAAEELYRGLEVKFAHHQEVADFWRRYAVEEAGHARWLERLRDTLSPEQLSAPADPLVLKEARKVLQFSIENALRGYRKTRNLLSQYNSGHKIRTQVLFMQSMPILLRHLVR